MVTGSLQESKSEQSLVIGIGMSCNKWSRYGYKCAESKIRRVIVASQEHYALEKNSRGYQRSDQPLIDSTSRDTRSWGRPESCTLTFSQCWCSNRSKITSYFLGEESLDNMDDLGGII